jgi:hypothetical protein
MIDALLAVMLVLAPGEPADRLRAVATAIAQTAESRDEAAVLLTISFYETRFERNGVPFGVVSRRRQIAGQPLEVAARAALGMYRVTRRCGRHVAVRLGWYHTGNCRADAFSRREARTHGRVMARLPSRLWSRPADGDHGRRRTRNPSLLVAVRNF